MIAQIEELQDSSAAKHQLMLYLGFGALGSAWESWYVEACSRLLNDPADISLFGVLVRDVDPNELDLDLKNRTPALPAFCMEISYKPIAFSNSEGAMSRASAHAAMVPRVGDRSPRSIMPT